jgi:hypothetical protein
MLHPMRQPRASEAKFCKSVLKRLEVGEPLNNDDDVSVIGHLRTASIRTKLWDKGTYGSEWNAEFAQAALEIRQHGNERWVNAKHCPTPSARVVRPLQGPAPLRGSEVRHTRKGRALTEQLHRPPQEPRADQVVPYAIRSLRASLGLTESKRKEAGRIASSKKGNPRLSIRGRTASIEDE